MTSTDSPYVWTVAAPFLKTPDSPWICDFAPSGQHRFVKVSHAAGDVNWHDKKSQGTGLSEWSGYSATASALLDSAAEADGGAITVFPQLAATAALKKRLRRRDTPLIAWFFNTTFGRDAKSMLARPALRSVDRFVVHSTDEIQAYADHLRVSTDKFSFAHVQYGGAIQTDEEDTDEPFVFATGSGFRDYGTFFEAVEMLGHPTKVVAGPRVLAGLAVPSNVEIIEGVDRSEIHRMVRRATVNVLPMHTEGLTAGLVTMAEAFRHGRSLVVSERGGISDYVQHDQNALLVPQKDPKSMAEAIDAVWSDAVLRARLNACALTAGKERHTDEAAGLGLVKVLDEVLGSRSAVDNQRA